MFSTWPKNGFSPCVLKWKWNVVCDLWVVLFDILWKPGVLTLLGRARAEWNINSQCFILLHYLFIYLLLFCRSAWFDSLGMQCIAFVLEKDYIIPQLWLCPFTQITLVLICICVCLLPPVCYCVNVGWRGFKVSRSSSVSMEKCIFLYVCIKAQRTFLNQLPRFFP